MHQDARPTQALLEPLSVEHHRHNPPSSKPRTSPSQPMTSALQHMTSPSQPMTSWAAWSSSHSSHAAVPAGGLLLLFVSALLYPLLTSAFPPLAPLLGVALGSSSPLGALTSAAQGQAYQAPQVPLQSPLGSLSNLRSITQGEGHQKQGQGQAYEVPKGNAEGTAPVYSCAMRRRGSGMGAPGVAPACKAATGVARVYQLNPKLGTEFEGARALSRCLAHCRAERGLLDTSRKPPQGSPTDFSKGSSRRLLQQQVQRDGARASARRSHIQPLPSRAGAGEPQPQPHRQGAPLRTDAGGSGAAASVAGNVHPDGLYYIAVGLGDPPRTFFLDIDTGSHISWVTCDAPCVSCAKGPNGFYSPANADLIPCNTPQCQAAQAGGSFQGCFAPSASSPSEEGKGTSQRGSSRTGATGQEGLARHVGRSVEEREVPTGHEGVEGQAEEGGGGEEPDGPGLQCDYDVRYGDGSWSQGVLVADALHFLHPSGALKSAPFAFGCAYDQEGHLAQSPAKTDGLLGLGVGPLSLPSQLKQAGLLSNVFGNCLAPGPGGGGFFFLGGSLAPAQGVTWVQRLSVPGLPYYFLPLLQLKLGSHVIKTGQPGIGAGAASGTETVTGAGSGDGSPAGRGTLGAPGGRRSGAQGTPGAVRTVVDSGSSFSYLPGPLFRQLLAAVRAEAEAAGLEEDPSSTTLPHCWTIPRANETVQSPFDSFFPDMQLSFSSTSLFSKSTTVAIRPYGFLILTEGGSVCLGFLETDVPLIVLGDVSLRGQLVVYDNERGRIGWMPSKCQQEPKA